MIISYSFFLEKGHSTMFNGVYSGKVTNAVGLILNQVHSRVTVAACRYGTPSRSETVLSIPSDNSSFPENISNLKSYSDIPGPKGLPVIGTLWDYMKEDGFKFSKMFEVMQQRAETYGPVYKEKIGPETLVVISDPKEYMNVMRVDGKYPNRPYIEPVFHYQKKRGTTLGILNGQGEEWYVPRIILSKKLLRPQELVQYIQCMNDVAEDFVKRVKNLTSSGSTVPHLEMELYKWSLESVGTMVFEQRIGCFDDPPPPLTQEFITNINELMDNMQKLMFGAPLYKIFPTKSWKKFERSMDNNIRLAKTLIKKKLDLVEKQEVGKDDIGENLTFLTYLFANFSPQDAISHAVDVLAGGIETTSHAMLWLMYCLARNPEAQDILYTETMRVLSSGEFITEASLQQMQYTKACLKETFRLYPVATGTSRRLAKDISVCGYHVPKGTHCQANVFAMGRNKELYNDPLSFKPERWLRENKEDTPVTYLSNLTFGHGARMCIGRRLAEQEIYILITKTVQNFRMEYSDEDVIPTQNVLLVPDRPVNLKFIPRQKHLG